MRLWGNSWGDDGLVGLGRWGAGLVLKTLRVCYENHTAPFCPPSCQWLWTHVCSLMQPLSPARHPQDGKCLQHCEMQNLSLFFWLFPPPAFQIFFLSVCHHIFHFSLRFYFFFLLFSHFLPFPSLLSFPRLSTKSIPAGRLYSPMETFECGTEVYLLDCLLGSLLL